MTILFQADFTQYAPGALAGKSPQDAAPGLAASWGFAPPDLQTFAGLGGANVVDYFYGAGEEMFAAHEYYTDETGAYHAEENTWTGILVVPVRIPWSAVQAGVKVTLGVNFTDFNNGQKMPNVSLLRTINGMTGVRRDHLSAGPYAVVDGTDLWVYDLGKYAEATAGDVLIPDVPLGVEVLMTAGFNDVRRTEFTFAGQEIGNQGATGPTWYYPPDPDTDCFIVLHPDYPLYGTSGYYNYTSILIESGATFTAPSFWQDLGGARELP